MVHLKMMPVSAIIAGLLPIIGDLGDYLAKLPGVTEVHDLYIWAMSTTETALTAHLVKPETEDEDSYLSRSPRGCTRSLKTLTPQFSSNAKAATIPVNRLIRKTCD